MFYSITVPLLKPTLFLVLILGFIDLFKQYGLVVTMTNGGPAGATKFAVQYIYEEAFQKFRFGYASALSMVLLMLLAVITALQPGTRLQNKPKSNNYPELTVVNVAGTWSERLRFYLGRSRHRMELHQQMHRKSCSNIEWREVSRGHSTIVVANLLGRTELYEMYRAVHENWAAFLLPLLPSSNRRIRLYVLSNLDLFY